MYSNELITLICGNKWKVFGNKLIKMDEEMISIELPSSIQFINKEVFIFKEIEEIEIPTYVTSIDDYCFSMMTQLKRIQFHSNIKRIGKGCFSGDIHLDMKKDTEIIKENVKKTIWLTEKEIKKIEF